MASRRRRRTDSDNSGTSFGEQSNQGFNMKDEKKEETAGSSSTTFSNFGSLRDRSSEFCAIVRSIKQSNQGRVAEATKSSYSLQKQRNQFTLLAKKLSRDLANVYSKLDKLTQLAKRKSIFDDKEPEIDHLTSLIKNDIGLLNKEIAQLQELSRAQRTGTGHDKQIHANSVLVALQSKLANMTSDFQNVLQVRTETLQVQQNRRNEFSSAANISSSLPSQSSSSTRWLLLDEEKRSDVAIDMNNMQDGGPRLQQLQNSEDKFVQSRVDTMKNIEQTIVELGSIYQQLAHMVQEQGEMVQRIDSNVDESQTNIDLAHNEIVRYFQSVSSNRWLMVKVFAVLVFFFILFVVFIA